MPIDLTSVSRASRGREREEIDQQSSLMVESLLPVVVPEGRFHGHQYDMLNPTRNDASYGSFSYNIHKHYWQDFATGHKGRYLISLYQYVTGSSYHDAVEAVRRMIGGSTVAVKSRKVTGIQNYRNISPVPDGVKPPDLGNPTHVWTYRDAGGGLVCYRCRYQGEYGKYFVPRSYWTGQIALRATWTGWRRQNPTPPYGLYRLDQLAARPSAPVIVCEGEKAADAAQAFFPDHVAVTSPNGAGSALKTDWSPLAGREVKIWPDNDAPGLTYAQQIRQIIGGTILDVFEYDLPEGWDAADATFEQAQYLMENN